jgi:hypothetical protein
MHSYETNSLSTVCKYTYLQYHSQEQVNSQICRQHDLYMIISKCMTQGREDLFSSGFIQNMSSSSGKKKHGPQLMAKNAGSSARPRWPPESQSRLKTISR